jgi:hypothetical protein
MNQKGTAMDGERNRNCDGMKKQNKAGVESEGGTTSAYYCTHIHTAYTHRQYAINCLRYTVGNLTFM